MTAIAVEAPTYNFEAMGFVATRRTMAALEARGTPDNEKMFTPVRRQLEPLGFTGIEEVYLSEDDGQDSTDIKVFVVVKLQGGQAGLYRDLATVGLPPPLEEALNALAAHVCCNSRGEDRVGAEDWEFSNGYEFA